MTRYTLPLLATLATFCTLALAQHPDYVDDIGIELIDGRELPHYGPPPKKHPPKHIPHKQTYKSPKKPYKFAYGVDDPYQGLQFGQQEDSDGGQVHGSYTVQLPDGRRQIVNYIADHHQGYIAEVKYEGKAQYPPKSDQAPFIVAPQKGYEPEPHKQPSYH